MKEVTESALNGSAVVSPGQAQPPITFGYAVSGDTLTLDSIPADPANRVTLRRSL